MSSLARTLLWTLPAASAYVVLLPLLAIRVDRGLGLLWRLPTWLESVGWVMVALGATVAAWTAWLFTSRGKGTPNPMAPPLLLVTEGPYRRSRNPMMLGGWLGGIGLAVMLRSLSMLVLVGVIIVAGVAYVRVVEEPKLVARFGRAYLEYMGATPRWMVLAIGLLASAAVASQGSVTVSEPREPSAVMSKPAILVQIRCKPGTAELWRRSFDQEIGPSIREVIAQGDSFTNFTLLESALPAQPFDFALMLEGRSFGDSDQRRPFPHYRALFRRIGPLRAQLVLKEMIDWEEAVTVTLVRRYGEMR